MNNVINFLNSTGKVFIDFSASMLIQSSVLIIVLLIVDRLLRKRVRAVFRYWIWMLVLAKLVLPVSLSSPVSMGQLFGDKLSTGKSEAFATATKDIQKPVVMPENPAGTRDEARERMDEARGMIDEQRETTRPSSIIHPPSSTGISSNPPPPTVATISLSWHGFALLGWLAALIAMVLLLVQRLFFIRGLLAQSKQPGQYLTEIFQQCTKQIVVRSPVALALSPIAASPSVCGLVRPSILIPQTLPGKLETTDLQAILLHELAHIKRGDLFISLIQTLLQIAYFYNPLLWVANAFIRSVREQAVDEMVLAAMGEQAENYPQTLLNVSKLTFSRPALSLRLIGVVESKKALAERIKHIVSRPFPKTAKLGILGLLVILAAAAILLPMAKKAKINYYIDGVEGYIRCSVTRAESSRAILNMAQVYGFKHESSRGVGNDESPIQYCTDNYIIPDNKKLTFETVAEKGQQIRIDISVEPGAIYTIGEIAIELARQMGIFPSTFKPMAKRESNVAEITPSSGQFTATLPGGVTVELLGICEHPSDGKQWWRPDGQQLNYEIKTLDTSQYPSDDPGYEFVFRQTGSDDSFKIESIKGSDVRSGIQITQPEGLTGYRVHIKKSYKSTDIKIASESGNWQTAVTSNGKSSVSGKVKGNTIVMAAAEQAGQDVIISCSDSVGYEDATRITAVDSSGREFRGQTKTDTGVNNIRQRTIRFAGLNLSNIKEFRLQTCSYEYYTFSNVSLRPNAKTTVQTILSLAREQMPLPKLTAHKYYKVGEPIQITVAGGKSSGWKPTLLEIYHDESTRPVFFMIDDKEYDSRIGLGPFESAVMKLNIPGDLYVDMKLAVGRHTIAYGWRNVDVINPEEPKKTVHFDRLSTQEAGFEVVSVIPDGYYSEVYEQGWENILARNISTPFTDDIQKHRAAGALLTLAIEPLPFDISFEVYAQAEGSEEREYIRTLARQANSIGSLIMGCDKFIKTLTWDNVGQKRYRLILVPSEKVAAANPPIQHYYGREYVTEWATFEKSENFEQHYQAQIQDKELDRTKHYAGIIRDDKPVDLDRLGRKWSGNTDAIQPPEGFELGWSSKNGGVLRINPDSNVKMLWFAEANANLVHPDAKTKARLVELSGSATTEINPPKGQNTLIAVKSSEDKVYFVRVSKVNEQWANLAWWQVDETKSTTFKSTLPGGATVELLGICKDPNGAKQWWWPDGSKMHDVPFDNTGGRAYPNNNENEYAFAVSFTNIPEGLNSIFFTEPSNGRAGGSLYSSVKKDGKELSQYQDGRLVSTVSFLVTVFDKNLKECTFKVGIADGLWQTKFEFTKTQNSWLWGNSSQGRAEGEAVFGKPMEQNQKTWIAITHSIDPKVYDIRIVAETNNGKELKPVQNEQGGVSNAIQNTVSFDAPLENIKAFRLRTRKYQWITFNNVSLRPDSITDVQIEAEKPAGLINIEKANLEKEAGDQNTLIKFNSTSDTLGIVKTANDTKSFSKTYDVKFKKGEKLLLVAELYKAGEPMKIIGHKIFEQPKESDKLIGNFSYTNLDQSKTITTHQGNVQLGEQFFNIPEFRTNFFPSSTWWEWFNGDALRQNTDRRGRDSDAMKILFYYAGTYSGSKNEAKFWTPAYDTTPVEVSYAFVLKAIPISRLEFLYIEPIGGYQGLNGKIIEKSLSVKDAEMMANDYKQMLLNIVNDETKDTYSATLPNGVTVELLGICEHPSDGKQWWRPDGQIWNEKPFNEYSSTFTSGDNKGYDLVYRIASNEKTVHEIKSDDQKGLSGPAVLQKETGLRDKFKDGSFYGVQLLFPPNQNVTSISIGAGLEKSWKTVVALTGNVEIGSASNENVYIYPAVESNGRTVIHAEYKFTSGQREAFRIVVLDSRNKQLVADSGSSTESPESIHLQRQIDLPVKEIKEIWFQTQPLQWVTFKNVSLQPNSKTDVQIEAPLSDSKIEPLPSDLISEMFNRIEKDEEIDLKLIYQSLIGPQTTLRADAAGYLGIHGNSTSIPYLIDALSDESVHVGVHYIDRGMETTRYWANDSLKKLTSQDFGFIWNDPKEKRDQAIQKWRTWWEQNKDKPAEP
jgi:beta-lactamase regulating signal transducer with metallopeptidase domain